MEANQLLVHLVIKYNGDYEKVVNAIKTKEDVSRDTLLGVSTDYITLLDAEYPTKLKRTFRPPFVLFYKGDISLLNEDNILSFVNEKYPTEEAVKTAEYLMNDYKGVVIIGDSTCGLNDVVMAKDRKLIVVLANGLDKSEDLVNKVVAMGGLVITEYPNNCDKYERNYFDRNRIIEGIANKTLVIEIAGKHTSGFFRYETACNNGNEVFVVPKAIYSEEYMNNELIYEGAKALLFKEDLTGE